MNLYNWLFESADYKVYSNYEYVYLKNKNISLKHDEYDNIDTFIQWIYGDPTGAIITPNQEHVIIVGSGIYRYNIISKELKEFFNESGSINWIEAIYQEEKDDWNNEFRIVCFNNNAKLRVYKFDMISETLTEID